MDVKQDYENLAKRLIAAYAKAKLENKPSKEKARVTDNSSAQILSQVATILDELKRYSYGPNLDKALDAIDLPRIYSGVDKRELENTDGSLGYQDFIVLETLDYFKNHFFKWVNKPECPQCHKDGDNMIGKGRKGPPSPNPDQIGMIEVYWCNTCNKEVTFPRIGSPAKLLETRKGRCGEWVSCFILVLRAVLGDEARIRYVWNREDHVWCEYYSNKLGRYVHLDPCENAFDNPLLYCDNWGKQMSWVIGIGEDYVVDLSCKYVTRSKQIPKLSVANEKVIATNLEQINQMLLQKYWQEKVVPTGLSDREQYLKLYHDIILIKNVEAEGDKKVVPLKLTSAPQGRQTGSAEWTKSRGESGQP